MNYKLVKQLKDKGFPQEGKGEIDCLCRHKGKGNIMTQSERDGSCGKFAEVYVPTLSELIEACGKDFSYLEVNLFRLSQCLECKEAPHWLCIGWSRKLEELLVGNAKTPQEAVAKLWLKLNEPSR